MSLYGAQGSPPPIPLHPHGLAVCGPPRGGGGGLGLLRFRVERVEG